MSDWFPQLSLHVGLGHWTAAPLLGTICPELGGQMLVWGEADGEEFTLVWGTLAVHPHPALPGDLNTGAAGLESPGALWPLPHLQRQAQGAVSAGPGGRLQSLLSPSTPHLSPGHPSNSLLLTQRTRPP